MNGSYLEVIIIIEYSIGWGTLALINAGIAQGKNKSGFNWFIASLILGPIATLFLVLSGKKSNESDNKDLENIDLHFFPKKTSNTD